MAPQSAWRTYSCVSPPLVRLPTLLSGSIRSCTENGFVRNAMHPESSAALRMAGSSFPVM